MARSGNDVEGRALTTWSVLPGGEQVCLGFASAEGETHRIVLPFDALSSLLMTLPRMLRSALDERFPDGASRVVHPLGPWRVEQPAGLDGLILTLATRDGFEVAFAVPDGDAGCLGRGLLGAADEITELKIRRPN